MSDNEHRWSGWPGAYCIKCGAEDMLETALALGWFDPGHPGNPNDVNQPAYEASWDTLEHEALVVKSSFCPIK